MGEEPVTGDQFSLLHNPYPILLLLLWLAICAYQDYRTGQVSNWLTLPLLALALALRLVGWLTTPWWTIGLVWALALYLWRTGKLGGADAKAWMTFSLLGIGVLWSAYFGLLIWYVAINWSLIHIGIKRGRRVPGFPGYLMGISGAVLLSVC